MQIGTSSTSSSSTLESESGEDAGVLSHAVNVLAELADLRHSASLCDVVLIGSDEKTVGAHRALLAASTPYFRAMLTGGLRETGQRTIRFPAISGDTLECLVDYIYSGRVNVTERNVEEVLESASLWQLNSVLETCSKFLLRRLDAGNCLNVASLGKLLSLPALYDGAMSFAERHFAEISQSADLLSLPADVLGDLLTRDGLFVRSESEVFDACIKWLKYEWPCHLAEAPEVLRWVRWPCVPPSTLACLDCDEELQFLRELPECATLLQYAKWGEWHAVGQRHKSWMRVRNSIACSGTMFAMGGETNPRRRIINDAEKYNSLTGSWECIRALPRACRGAAAVFVDNLVYVGGGSDGLCALFDILCYEPLTDSWDEAGRMLEMRSSVGAVAIGHSIYFIGGYDGMSTCHQTVEVFNTQTRQSKSVAPMGTARSMCAVALLEGRVYAAGGYDGSGDMRSVECYDPAMDTWVGVAPMMRNRSMAGAAVLSGRLFIVGGSSGTMVYDSAEVYEPSADVWSPIAAMGCARSGLGVAVVRGSMFVLGGYDGRENLASVESYDEDSQEWILQPPMMRERRRFSICCPRT